MERSASPGTAAPRFPRSLRAARCRGPPSQPRSSAPSCVGGGLARLGWRIAAICGLSAERGTSPAPPRRRRRRSRAEARGVPRVSGVSDRRDPQGPRARAPGDDPGCGSGRSPRGTPAGSSSRRRSGGRRPRACRSAPSPSPRASAPRPRAAGRRSPAPDASDVPGRAARPVLRRRASSGRVRPRRTARRSGPCRRDQIHPEEKRLHARAGEAPEVLLVALPRVAERVVDVGHRSVETQRIGLACEVPAQLDQRVHARSLRRPLESRAGVATVSEFGHLERDPPRRCSGAVCSARSERLRLEGGGGVDVGADRGGGGGEAGIVRAEGDGDEIAAGQIGLAGSQRFPGEAEERGRLAARDGIAAAGEAGGAKPRGRGAGRGKASRGDSRPPI